MLTLSSTIANNITSLISYSYRTTRHVASFRQRIKTYNNKLNIYERQFHMRPPNLQTKNTVTFPIKVPFLLRHRKIVKKGKQFVDSSEKIHWNRLSPNQILLAFEHLEYLEYYEMMEGLKYLSEIKGQEDHDWNTHPWISKALDEVDRQFNKIKTVDRLNVYYLMKKLRYSKPEFWSKMYALIQENIYDLYPSEFEKFFKKYYKVSDQYFSSEMKQKFLTLMENRLRSFSSSGIIWMYQLFQEENRLDDYWKFNVFIPLFKSDQYYYSPQQLRKIFRFMMVLGHENDERLYASLYKRLMNYQELSQQEVDGLIQVVEQVKDIFVSHRVNPYIDHLNQMKQKVIQMNASKKKQIPIHELVRQDLIFVMHKRKLKQENTNSEKQLNEKVPDPEKLSNSQNNSTAII